MSVLDGIETFAVGDVVWNTQTGESGTIIALSPGGAIATRLHIVHRQRGASSERPYYVARWQFTKDAEKACRYYRERSEAALRDHAKWENALASAFSARMSS